MAAQASYAPFQCIDICTGELFAPTKDQCQVKANRVQGVDVLDSITSLQMWFIPWSLADRMLSILTTSWIFSCLIIQILLQMNVCTYCDILIWQCMLYCHIVVLLYCDIVMLSYCSVVLMMFVLLFVMLLSANDSVYFAKHQRTCMSTCWHWKNACLQNSNQQTGHQMLQLLVRHMMRIYTAWCKLFGICLTWDKSCKRLPAQYAAALQHG